MSRPVFHGLVRMRVAAELRRRGYGFVESRELSHGLSAELIEAGVQQTEGAVAAIGDGTILKMLMDFLNSPIGKMLIELLLSFLL